MISIFTDSLNQKRPQRAFFDFSLRLAACFVRFLLFLCILVHGLLQSVHDAEHLFYGIEIHLIVDDSHFINDNAHDSTVMRVNQMNLITKLRHFISHNGVKAWMGFPQVHRGKVIKDITHLFKDGETHLWARALVACNKARLDNVTLSFLILNRHLLHLEAGRVTVHR